MDSHDVELKKELNATLQARRELGDEYESGGGGADQGYVGHPHRGRGGRRGGRHRAAGHRVVGRG
ncbi:hypothetical protein ACFWP5_21575, partial [Streptomyces sp. NPDC058469]